MKFCSFRLGQERFCLSAGRATPHARDLKNIRSTCWPLRAYLVIISHRLPAGASNWANESVPRNSFALPIVRTGSRWMLRFSSSLRLEFHRPQFRGFSPRLLLRSIVAKPHSFLGSLGTAARRLFQGKQVPRFATCNGCASKDPGFSTPIQQSLQA